MESNNNNNNNDDDDDDDDNNNNKISTRQIKRTYCFLLLSTPNNSLSTDTIVGSSLMLLSVLNKYFKQKIYCF